MKTTATTKWCWKSLVGYSIALVITGFAISLFLLKTVKLSNDLSLPSRSPYDPYFLLGSALLAILAPIATVTLNWRLKELIVALAIATGLLTTNLGFGIGLTLFCAGPAYLVVNKVAQVIAFYFPRNTEQDGRDDGDEPPN
jgi:hypothetical protein